jgi:hypothetical protein
MLTALQVVLYAAVVAILLPLTVYSLVNGSRPSETRLFARYYRAERFLSLAGDLLLLAICASSVARLADLLGYLDPSMKDSLGVMTGSAVGVTVLVFLALLAKAAFKVHRNGGNLA